MPVVEETARMKKARLAGLDTRGKHSASIFLRKHSETGGEGSSEAPASSLFQPALGFRRQNSVVGSLNMP